MQEDWVVITWFLDHKVSLFEIKKCHCWYDFDAVTSYMDFKFSASPYYSFLGDEGNSEQWFLIMDIHTSIFNFFYMYTMVHVNVVVWFACKIQGLWFHSKVGGVWCFALALVEWTSLQITLW